MSETVAGGQAEGRPASIGAIGELLAKAGLAAEQAQQGATAGCDAYDEALAQLRQAGIPETVTGALGMAVEQAYQAEHFLFGGRRLIEDYAVRLHTGVHTAMPATSPTPVPPPAPAIPRTYGEPITRRYGRPTLPEEEFLALDDQLQQGLAAAVAAIDWPKLTVISPNRGVPRILDKFRLVPLQRKPGVLYDNTSLSYMAHQYTIPPDVRLDPTRDESEPEPYMDALGIGLAYDGMLVAVSAAGLTRKGQLKIVQLQDVTGWQARETKRKAEAQRKIKAGEKPDPPDPKARYRTGLYNGIDWRASLIEAWGAVAQHTGVGDELAVQSAGNSMWDKVRVRVLSDDPHRPLPQGYAGYDAVAQRQNFDPEPGTGDWVRPIKRAKAVGRATLPSVAAPPASRAAT